MFKTKAIIIPMQFLAPALNGKYPNINFALFSSSKNLSGINSSAFGYISSLRCRIKGYTVIVVIGGIMYLSGKTKQY